MTVKIVSKSQYITFSVKVLPGARTTELAGVEGENLKIRVAAPPVDGKANQALLKFLSDRLGVPKSSLRIQSGQNSRRKVISVEGCDEQKVRNLVSESQ